MKEEEFNDFLRNRADSFELKPSSGSFDAAVSKITNNNKKRRVLFVLPFLVVALGTAIFYYSNSTEAIPNTIVAQLQNNDSQAQSTIKQIPKTQATANINEQENKSLTMGALSNHKNHKKHNVTASTNTLQVNSKRKANTFETGNTNTTITTNTSKHKEPLKAKKDQQQTKTTSKDKKISDVDDKAAIEMESAAIKNKTKPKSSTSNKESMENNKHTISTCNNKKWAIRAYINPFTAQGTYNGENSRGGQNLSLGINQNENFIEETLNNGINVGINIERKLSKRWSLGLGLAYSKWDLDVSDWTNEFIKDSVANYRFDTSINQVYISGYTITQKKELMDSNVTNVSFQSLQIPIYLNFELINKKRFSFDMQLGIVATTIFKVTHVPTRNIVFNQNTVSTTNKRNRFYEYRGSNINLSAGLMAHYTIGKCWGVYGGPNLGVSLLSIQLKESGISQKPIFLGFETGLRFKF